MPSFAVSWQTFLRFASLLLFTLSFTLDVTRINWRHWARRHHRSGTTSIDLEPTATRSAAEFPWWQPVPSANSTHEPRPTPRRSLAKTNQVGDHAHFFHHSPCAPIWRRYLKPYASRSDMLQNSLPHPSQKYILCSQKYLQFFQRRQAAKDALTSEVSPALLPSVNNHTFSPLPLTQDKTAGVIGKSQLKVKNSTFFLSSSVQACINVLLSKRGNHAWKCTL